MNHIYRLVFNRALGTTQVASETTRSRGKTSHKRQFRKLKTCLQTQGLTMAVAALVGFSIPTLADTSLTTGGEQTLVPADGTYTLPEGQTITASAQADNGGSGRAALTGEGYTLTNDGQVFGGQGGSGGNSSVGFGGNGGAGGAAVSGSDFELHNSGTLTGGKGQSGGNALSSGIGGNGGNGGAGVSATGGVTISNSGTIFGGTEGGSGHGPIRGSAGSAGDAVSFSGGGNTLILQDGSSIRGNIKSTSGTMNGGDALILEGSQSNTLSMSGVSGFASYTKRGTGNWTLAGTPAPTIVTTIVTTPPDPIFCTFPGMGMCNDVETPVYTPTPSVTSWDIQGGTLNVSTDASLGDMSGGLTLSGGTLLTSADFTSARNIIITSNSAINNGGHNDAFSGVISGNGGVTFAGFGTTTLSGSNTYTGATIVSAGALKADAANTFASSSAMTVASGATLNLNDLNQQVGSLAGAGNVALGSAVLTAGGDNSSTTFSGAMAGSGGVTKVGTGTMTLSGTNTYTGATTIKDGTLSVSSDANLGNGGGLALNGGTLLTTADLSSARDIALSGSNTINNGGHNDTFSGVISGNGGVTFAGKGTTTLSGRNNYTGATTVSAGTLALTDTAELAGLTTIQSGATLQANSASIGGISNEGSVAVGAGKTLRLSGDFTNTGTFTTAVAGDNNYGKLDIMGTATLEGTLAVDVLGSPNLTVPGKLASVIHANNISGTFARVTDNSTLFDFSATYSATDVGLNIAADNINGSGPYTLVETIVQRYDNNPALAAARALGHTFASNPSGELASLFIPLTSEAQVNNAVSQTLPLLVGGSQVVTTGVLSNINHQVQTRMAATRGLSSGDGFYGDQTLWLKPFGSWTEQQDRHGVSGFDANTSGLVLGTDGSVSDITRVGLAFAYAHTDVNGNAGIAVNNADIDTYQLLGYGSHSLDAQTELNVQIGLGQNRNQGQRSIEFANSTAKADYDSHAFTLGTGLSRTYYVLGTATQFTPSVRADYSWIQDESYTETGAGALNLQVDKRSTDALVTGLDGKLTQTFGAATILSANLGVGYDLLQDQASITSTYAGAPGVAFTTEGIDPSPLLLRSGLDLSHQVTDALEVSARYDVEHRSDFLNQTASVKVRWAF
ncbi:MAG: autotransporter domain-containing protein [Candidatus Oceanisphaera merdipullorum]|nr:autotransporter domain-containing protein [Candidatus Oceanisphaera merdipullorum]